MRTKSTWRTRRLPDCTVSRASARLAAAALAVALTFGGESPRASPSPSPPPSPLWSGPTLFLVQAHLRRLNAPYLRRIAAAGFDGVRIPLVPWWAQSRHGGWVWTDYDAIYRWLRIRKLTPLFVLQNPRSVDDLPMIQEFAALAAVRYPNALLELGNEPDSRAQWPGFYPPASNQALTPERYWSIERGFARTWHAANPNGRISTGGTSGFDFDWQRRLIAAIARDGAFADGTIAAAAVHAYGEPLPPRSSRRADVVRDLTRLKSLLPDGEEVWVTEYGLTDPQPADVTGWLTAMSALGVSVFSWYEIQDDILDGQTQRYGLLQLDGTPRPAYATARAFLQGRARVANPPAPTRGS